MTFLYFTAVAFWVWLALSVVATIFQIRREKRLKQQWIDKFNTAIIDAWNNIVVSSASGGQSENRN